ncbi:MAG: DNA polymerase/3'-5' exonuclease PolX [Proteobacteria bacterium]|nr:DNA polymerase/3'-5' exonuclease PolX [Pseudomonadota bacterium]
MDKKEVAAILDEIGTLLELKGENPFKSRAYYAGARAVESLDGDLLTAVRENRLRDIKGIGEGLAQKISELALTGQLSYYEDLKRQIPESLRDMLRIPGLGPKKIKVLHQELGISTIGELEYACNENRLIELPGFGEKSQEKVLQGIGFIRKYQNQFLYSTAITEAESIVSQLSGIPRVIRASLAGSIRRKKEIVKDIDMVVSTRESSAVMDLFTSLPLVESVIAKGDTKSSIITSSGIQADLRTVSDKEFPFAIHHFTGSKEHNIAMRGRAIRLGMKMNEYGLFKGERLISCADEEEVFKNLHLDYIPPELREARDEIEAAEKHQLPRLVEEKDIRGAFHVHTTHSDGTCGLDELIKEARTMGYSYLGISEHSQSAHYARGLKPDQLAELFREIDALNRQLKGFYVFKGTESDIRADGSLDYDERILEACDFVIASVHSHFNQSQAEMTERIIKAIRNPFVTMLGHPTGRLLLSREPYAVDMVKVIDAVAEEGVVIEINAHPQRLDLDWRLGHYAKGKGVMLSINPDAHNREGLRDVVFGVQVARKGWLGPENILNTMKLDELKKFLEQRKKRARGKLASATSSRGKK